MTNNPITNAIHAKKICGGSNLKATTDRPFGTRIA